MMMIMMMVRWCVMLFDGDDENNSDDDDEFTCNCNQLCDGWWCFRLLAVVPGPHALNEIASHPFVNPRNCKSAFQPSPFEVGQGLGYNTC